ncbi:MAG: terminase large subunit [bacterium]|nr:terminase large subunit [bacterium]
MSTVLADQLTLARWRQDRMAFRCEGISLENGRPLGEVLEPWQREDFVALDSGEYQHAYLERPRGHAKTFDLGTEAVAELVLGRPGQRLFCAAADEDQARLLFEDVADKFRRSPLLRGSVRVLQREIVVRATGSRLRVLSSDAPTAYGLRPDWIAVDELAEWRRRELWDSLWSATGKRPTCRMLVITTAGWDFAGIAWEVRQVAQQEADWYFSARGQCASWLRPEWLDQQRRTLPAHVFARLHESRWVEGAGAFLLASEVDAIFTPDLPTGPGPVAVGLDLGLARDAAVAAAVRRLSGGLVVVEALETWQPTAGRRVDLQEVEDAVAALARQFGAPVILDPWQGVLLGQRLRARGVRVEEYQFTAEGRRRLFSVLLDLIRTGRLRCRPHEALRRELLGLEVAETSAGWRVDHRPGRHDDHAIAVGLAAQQVAAAPVLAGRWSDVSGINADLHEAAQVWPGDTVLGQRRPRGL